MRPIIIAGVDEVGIGPLAGPVVAAAVILDRRFKIHGLADSKILPAETREILAEEIKAHAIAWALGRAEVDEIDRINILQAGLLAMRRAVAALMPLPTLALVDGIHDPRLHCRARTIIKGDETVPAISAASILAKVARDAEMRAMDHHFPGYDFSRHKGYCTPGHLAVLEKLGACAIHRRSFAPVRRVLVRDLV